MRRVIISAASCRLGRYHGTIREPEATRKHNTSLVMLLLADNTLQPLAQEGLIQLLAARGETIHPGVVGFWSAGDPSAFIPFWSCCPFKLETISTKLRVGKDMGPCTDLAVTLRIISLAAE